MHRLGGTVLRASYVRGSVARDGRLNRRPEPPKLNRWGLRCLQDPIVGLDEVYLDGLPCSLRIAGSQRGDYRGMLFIDGAHSFGRQVVSGVQPEQMHSVAHALKGR